MPHEGHPFLSEITAVQKNGSSAMDNIGGQTEWATATNNESQNAVSQRVAALVEW